MALCFLGGGCIIGGIIYKITPSKTDLISETEQKLAPIYREMDSLRRKYNIVGMRIDTMNSKLKITDVAIDNNLKNLANEIKVIKKFTPSSRSKYLDSLLTAGHR